MAPSKPASPLDGPSLVLRLYVTAASPKSARAIVNVRRLLEDNLAGRYSLEILAIAEHVEQAARDHIVASPTLLRLQPEPVRRFIGDLSDTARVLAGLGVK